MESASEYAIDAWLNVKPEENSPTEILRAQIQLFEERVETDAVFFSINPILKDDTITLEFTVHHRPTGWGYDVLFVTSKIGKSYPAYVKNARDTDSDEEKAEDPTGLLFFILDILNSNKVQNLIGQLMALDSRM